MVTELLYMGNSYLKEFSANVVGSGKGYVVLDRTAFYPEGGGQPSDTGMLGGSRVSEVRKDGGEIRHYTDTPISGKVHGIIDWERRYAHMRMHSAQHLLSAIALDRYGAETAGNQIHADRSRIDFTLDKITGEMRTLLEDEFNRIVDERRPIKAYMTTRSEMLPTIDPRRRKLFERVPPSVTNVRVVEIEGIDRCPCAGTHVASTGEIGYIAIESVKSKGKGKTRLTFRLEKGNI